MVGQARGADYYINQASTGTNSGTQANPWTDPTSANTVEDGSNVYIVANTGPYELTGTVRLSNDNVTWDLGGNELTGATNINNGSYEWHASGTTPFYYLTGASGVDPSLAVTPEVIKIGSEIIDTTKNYANAMDTYGFTSNWQWGNLDTLAFNTLYVKLYSGAYIDPTGSGVEIRVPIRNYLIIGDNNETGLLVKNGTLSGGNKIIAYMYGDLSFKNVTFSMCDDHALDFSDATQNNIYNINYCRFLSTGHRAFNLVTSSIINTINFYNNYIESCHLIGIINQTNAGTINFKNNSSKLLDAGVFNFGGTNNITLNEDYNQFEVDGDGAHSGKVFAYDGSGIGNWETTGSNSLPAGYDTSTNIDSNPTLNGTDGKVNSGGTLKSNSPCRNTGLNTVWSGTNNVTDLVSTPITNAAGIVIAAGGTVDIGAYEYRSRSKSINNTLGNIR